MTEREFYEELTRTVTAGIPAALATVTSAQGSTPRKAGAKMLVKHDGAIYGTVGGGRLEAITSEVAMRAMATATPQTLTFDLTEEQGYVCGGSVVIFIEPLNSCPQLVLFGAGHVGRAVAVLAAGCGFRVTVVDDRPDYALAALLPGAARVLNACALPAFAELTVDQETFIVVATKDHVEDFAIVSQALRTPAPFIGLVGSRRKREALFQQLREEKIAEEEFARVVTPVGLTIGAETPEEIAVSIVGQLIEWKRCRSGSLA
jgi:xanthine dehydrogenase accessory factor